MAITKKEQTGKNTYELIVKVDGEIFKKALDNSFKKNSAKIQVPGFRKGKAPRSIIEKMYGEGVFFEDAINECYPEAYEAAIKESELEPVNKPDVEVLSVDKEGFEFKANITVKPEVEISSYKGIKATKEVKTVTDADIDNQIEQLRERNSRMISVEDRASKNGDTVVFDFEGFVDGVAFDGGKAEKYSLVLGSGQFIPGFEGQLEGREIGSEFSVNVTFPEDYHAEELKGKPAEFKCKLHEIKEKELPELDDEFAKDVSEFDTLEALREDTRANLQKNFDSSAEIAFENELIDKVVENMTVEVPDCMIDNRVDEMVNEFAYRLSSQGMNLEMYMQYTGLDMDSMRKTYREQAEKQVKVRLALDKIAELENIEITDADLDAEFAKIAESYSMEVEKIKELIPADEVKKDMMATKAIELVKAESAPAAKKTAAKKAPAKKADDAEAPAAEKKPAAKKAPAKKAEEKAAE